MAAYYLDTSALMKRYFLEKGTPWVRSIFAQRNRLITARITHPEVASVLARRERCFNGNYTFSSGL